ncbi:MAG: Na-Ca exchanger/integrin-beta4, partial [Thermoleophilia bacterium]|nr:Na-Ca exchanger/integrin-beta4 [Thermoleophilia bacterium]
MAPSAPRSPRRFVAAAGTLLAAVVLACATSAQADSPDGDAPGTFGAAILDAARAPLVSTVHDRVPAALRTRLEQAATVTGETPDWAELPSTLDGRVRLAVPGQSTAGRAGWRMLDVPALRRIDLPGGAAYLGSEWDLVQTVDARRLREYVVVNEHQGQHTWRWQLVTARPGLQPVLRADGRVDLGNGSTIDPPRILDAELEPVGDAVHWALHGSVLSLTFDDTALPLPYVIDPDTTAPNTAFTSFLESSPWAYYNSANDVTRVWFNPAQSGTVTATINADDPETGVNYVSWPAGPTGWTPATTLDDSTSLDAPGVVGTYYDNAAANAYPGGGSGNFTPTNTAISRIDPNVNFNWGAGTPYAAFGVDTFSIRWQGKITTPVGETGTYYFQTNSDDGSRLWINNVDVVSGWLDQGPTNSTQCAGGITLNGGTTYDFKAEFYENGGGANMEARWLLPSQVSGGSYTLPTGTCDTSSAPRFNRNNSGPAPSSFPVIPASAFTIGGGAYQRSYSWTAGATGNTVNATSTNNGPNIKTSANVPFTFASDSAAPTLTSGTTDVATPGWFNSPSGNVNIPAAANFADVGSSAAGVGTVHRDLQRQVGVTDGSGGCTTSGGWATVATDVTGTSINGGALALSQCARYRVFAYDEVGNTYTGTSSTTFRGYDGTPPTVGVTSVVPGTNPQYQSVAGLNTVYVNTAFSGDFVVNATMSDTQSLPFSLTYFQPNLGTNWTPASNVVVPAPGPYAQSFAWTAGASSPNGENVQGRDTAGNTANGAFNILADTTGPGPGTATMATNASPPWRKVTTVLVTPTGLMSDAGAGVAKYRMQRDEVAYNPSTGVCGAFPGTWGTYVGSPSTVDANSDGITDMMPATTDSTIVDGMCYQYRLEATDRVQNVAYSAALATIRVDTQAPTVTLSGVAPAVSGNVPIAGTSNDIGSQVNLVTVRIENVTTSAFTTIGTDSNTPWSPNWAMNNPGANWVTTGFPDGPYKIHIDVQDAAGNLVPDAVVQSVTV